MKSIGESRLHARFPWATQVADEDKSGFIKLSVDDTKNDIEQDKKIG